jgi:hypothetical protein
MNAETESIEWLIAAIQCLPSDEPVAPKTPGYNVYITQKAHWLGWLNPSAGTGTYARKHHPSRTAKDVYSRIVEPKMLLWLATAAGVPENQVRAAKDASGVLEKLASKSAAVRKHIPWSDIVEALRRPSG